MLPGSAEFVRASLVSRFFAKCSQICDLANSADRPRDDHVDATITGDRYWDHFQNVWKNKQTKKPKKKQTTEAQCRQSPAWVGKIRSTSFHKQFLFDNSCFNGSVRSKQRTDFRSNCRKTWGCLITVKLETSIGLKMNRNGHSYYMLSIRKIHVQWKSSKKKERALIWK